MITHYKLVFKTVAARAFSHNFTEKVHLFWFQNFHVISKIQMPIPKSECNNKKTPQLFLICNTLWSFNFYKIEKSFETKVKRLP